MAERVYIGMAPSAFVSGGQRFRLSFRDTLGLLGGIRDPRWQPRLLDYIKALPGASQLAYPFPPAMSDDVARVAVLDVALMTAVPAIPLEQVMNRVAGIFEDTQLIRVTAITAANAADRASGQAGELAAAVSRDAELDQEDAAGGFFASVGSVVKGVGLWVVVVLVLVLGIVFYARRRSS